MLTNSQQTGLAMNETKKTKSPRRELVREEILTKAAEVFEQRGFTQTRIEDIARALDLKRSALYYYFKTKSDILHALVEDYVESKAREMEELLTNNSSSPSEKLRALLSASILTRTSGGARVRALDSVGTEMPSETKAAFKHARRKILDLHVQVIREGMEAGEFRSIDPRVAALAVLGVVNWISWWYSPTGRHDPPELAQVLVDIAINGLIRSELDRAQGKSPTEIIALIHKDLAELQRAISTEDASAPAQPKRPET